MSAVTKYMEDNLDIARVYHYPSGDELLLRSCLFCGRSEKMYVNVAKYKFNCYAASCGAKGSLSALVMAIEGCSFTVAADIITRLVFDAVAKGKPAAELAAMFAALMEGKGLSTEAPDLSVPLPEEFIPCYDASDDTYQVPQYLKDRGITFETLRRWGVGYCPNGKYAQRAIIPVHCAGMVSFVARDMTGRSSYKYLNPGTLQANFLLGYDKLDPTKPIYAMEGGFDALRWDSYHFQSVAYFGSFLREPQIDLLKKVNPPELVLVPDGEEYTNVVQKAKELVPYFKCLKVVRLPQTYVKDGREIKADPDAVPHRKAARALVAQAMVITGAVDALRAGFSAMRNPWDDGD